MHFFSDAIAVMWMNMYSCCIFNDLLNSVVVIWQSAVALFVSYDVYDAWDTVLL